jgi:hypothetical protein
MRSLAFIDFISKKIMWKNSALFNLKSAFNFNQKSYFYREMKINKLRLIAGLSVLLISMITDHYLNIQDFLSGALKGVAIGILITAFIKNPQKQKTA